MRAIAGMPGSLDENETHRSARHQMKNRMPIKKSVPPSARKFTNG
jgi:hypothetical protein